MMKNRLGIVAALLLLCFSLVLAKKDSPKVDETPFKSLPTNLFYFENSEVVIVHDTLPGIIYRSEDAGATWKKVKEIIEGQSLEVVPHPFNNKVAVAVGTARTHWVTQDQGATWTSFKTEGDAMLGGSPVKFHASDPDRMIFMTTECEGFACTLKVSIRLQQVVGAI